MSRDALIAVFLVCAPTVALAKTVHVDDDAPAGGDGSAKKPFHDVGDAMGATGDGDTIKLAVGLYEGNLKLKGRGRNVLGGYPGASADDYKAGQGGDFDKPTPGKTSVIQGASKKGAPVIHLVLSGGAKVELAGLTLRGGTGQYDYKWRGGGLLAMGGELYFHDSIVEDNSAYPEKTKDDERGKSLGGGVYVESKGKIDRVVIRKNRGGRGAGLSIAGGGMTLSNSLICDNNGDSDHAGGIYVTAPATLTNNRVERNSIGKAIKYGWGGGITVGGDKTKVTMTGNVFTGNYAPTKGSAVFIDDDAVATLTNELYYDNVCSKEGGNGLYIDGFTKETRGTHVTMDRSTIAQHDCGDAPAIFIQTKSSLVVTNSILWDNGKDAIVDETSSIKFTDSITQDGQKGSGNSSKNPRFADAGKGDFHLKGGCRWDAAGRRWKGDKDVSPVVKDAGDLVGAYAGTPQASKAGKCGGSEAALPQALPLELAATPRAK